MDSNKYVRKGVIESCKTSHLIPQLLCQYRCTKILSLELWHQ